MMMTISFDQSQDGDEKHLVYSWLMKEELGKEEVHGDHYSASQSQRETCIVAWNTIIRDFKNSRVKNGYFDL